MEQNLIGYLLNALDEPTQRQVKEYLATTPSAREQLETLRRSLQPLSWDAQSPEPPLGLVANTFAHINAQTTSAATTTPAQTSASPATIPMRPFAFLRRLDVLVAACLLAVVVGVGVSWLYRMHRDGARLACADDLREMFFALDSYRQKHDTFPNVDDVAKPPRNVAGLVVPKLVADGYLSDDFHPTCPSDSTVTLIQFAKAMEMNEADFVHRAAQFTPGYGYSLGVRDTGTFAKPPGYKPAWISSSLVALMADTPPTEDPLGNSFNHGRRGQNVMYIDGSVKFQTTRKSGYQGDDIYLNKSNKIGAGVDFQDSVIGPPWSKP